MIRHIVMWTLRDAADAPRFKTLLDGCAALVAGQHGFEVGIRRDGLEASADVVLVSTFADAAALDAYQNHPQHRAVAAQLGSLRSGRQVLDYEVTGDPPPRQDPTTEPAAPAREPPMTATITPTMTTEPGVNQQIRLVSRPQGEASTANFRLVEAPLPAPADLAEGEVLVRHHYLSLDPYMRGRMNEGKSYAQPQPLDTVMIGGTVGEVVASRHAGFAVGDAVVGVGGWQQYARVDATQPGSLRKVDATRIPLSAYLGPVGMPGVTGWYGLVKVCEPKAGDTVVVSAASGAVGSVVGQLAKARGCRAVGIAGGADKCAYVVDELGFDACVDYKAHAGAAALSAALKAAAPDGVDGYFENVGGVILDAVLPLMNAFGRIALCGMISGYDGQPIPLSQPQLILQSRLKLQGFIVSEHLQFWPEALKELGGMLAGGRLKYRETVAQGLASAPEAFIGLLKGRNFGKQLVKLT